MIPVSLYIPAEGGMLYHTYAPPFVRVTQAQVNLLLTMSDIEEIIDELYVVALSSDTEQTQAYLCAKDSRTNNEPHVRSSPRSACEDILYLHVMADTSRLHSSGRL